MSSSGDGLNFLGDHSETFLLSELYCGTPPSWLKVIGGVVGWVCGRGGLDGWQTLTRDPYLNHVLPLRHSKSYRVDGIAH